MPLNSVSGLASGIQWQDIVDAMVKADRASTAKLEQRKTTFQGRLDAVRSLNTKLLALSLDVTSINRPSAFQTRTATVSNATAASVTASSAATPGSLTVDIVAVAAARQLSTVPQAARDVQLGAGTVTLTKGSGSPVAVTIDAGSSTLDGIASAINAANAGVTASVVSTGSGPTPFRLLLTSRDTGVANAVSASGGGALAGLFTGMTTVQAAADAEVRIGSGPGAISIVQASNTFTDLANGVTLTARAPATGVQITVANDAKGVKERINALVGSYNAVIDEMAAKASYDPVTKAAGPLFSESDIRRDLQRLTTTMLTAVPGLPPAMSTLTALGLTVDRATGKMGFDEATLDAKLAQDPDGVMRIFTNSGTSSSTGVAFAALGAKTSTANPFTVQIATAAERAVMTGTALAAPVTITAANNRLDLALGGRDYQLTLANGTYTANQLADHVETVINQAVGSASERVDVANAGGALSITSRSFGFAVTMQTKASSTALADLGLTAQTVRGVDVVGLINGVAATGSGQVLTGATGTAAEGLRLTVTSSTPLTGVTVTARKGVAQGLSEAVRFMTDATTGTMKARDEGLSTTISGIDSQVKRNDERLTLRRERYVKMFLAMERSINQSNSLGTFLQGQIQGFQTSATAAANR